MLKWKSLDIVTSVKWARSLKNGQQSPLESYVTCCVILIAISIVVITAEFTDLDSEWSVAQLNA